MNVDLQTIHSSLETSGVVKGKKCIFKNVLNEGSDNEDDCANQTNQAKQRASTTTLQHKKSNLNMPLCKQGTGDMQKTLQESTST